MTPAEYEVLLADIAQGIQQRQLDLSPLRLGSGRSNRVMGASGYKHQIDVSLQDLNRLFIIECKRWDKRIGVAELLILASRTTDIQKQHSSYTVTPILATTKGATFGACKLADHFNVAIEIVKSAHEFGLRLGSFIHQGVAEGMGLNDEVKCAITRKDQVVDDLCSASK